MSLVLVQAPMITTFMWTITSSPWRSLRLQTGKSGHFGTRSRGAPSPPKQAIAARDWRSGRLPGEIVDPSCRSLQPSPPATQPAANQG